MQITLSLPEMLNAANVGVIRHYASTKKGSKPTEGFTEDHGLAISIHIEGAMGEACVARALGMYFEGSVNTYGKADLGKDIGVRAARKEHFGLLIYKKDNPNHYYYLVKGSAPNYRVCGWIKGSDAMQDKYLTDRVSQTISMWRIPESDLNPMTMEPPRN